MPNVITDDLLNDVMTAEAPKGGSNFFGQLSVAIWRSVNVPPVKDAAGNVITKGYKTPFDPQAHTQDQRRTSIDLSIAPLPGRANAQVIERDMIAESKDWTAITRPSLADLGLDIRQINGRYVQVEAVPTGRTYTNERGEKRDLTAFKFIRVFADMAECQAAADSFFGVRSSTSPASTSAPSGQSASVPQAATIVSPQRETAAKFLPAFWKLCNGDVGLFEQKIKGNPLTAAHFDLSSPEVIAVVAGG